MVTRLPWLPVEALGPRVFAEVKHAAIFECCKWDPQVEDVCTLSSLPVVLEAKAWEELVAIARKLAHETIAAETAILEQPSLLKKLGIPWALRRRLAHPKSSVAPGRHSRLIRFDFHFTTEGWRISEANSDVPGGFNEASGFTRLMARRFGDLTTSGDPVTGMVAAIAKSCGRTGTVALAHATAFSDDRQVMVFLSRRLEEAGYQAHLAAPDHLRWADGKASLATAWASGPVDFVFRFFPAEWLPSLPSRCGWRHLLGNSETPLCNPGCAIISQSKRFPLVWDQLGIPLPTWRAMLPATYDVRALGKMNRSRDSLVFKPALGRVGDMIRMQGVTAQNELPKIDRSIRRHPGNWVAQERFEAVPMASEFGDLYPCIGVYTLDGSVIGAYGRIGRNPLINHLAQDAAVLIATNRSSPLDSDTKPYEPLRSIQTVGA